MELIRSSNVEDHVADKTSPNPHLSILHPAFRLLIWIDGFPKAKINNEAPFRAIVEIKLNSLRSIALALLNKYR